MTALNEIKMLAPKKAQVLIYGRVGESFFSEGTTAKSFSDQLNALNDVEEIDVRINSPGGSVFEGVAIYNALQNHPAKINVHVDALAGSIASVIAMSGDTITMAENALMMIHEARGAEAGTASQLRQTADVIDRLNGIITTVYANRSKQDEATIKTAMSAETWYTAAEAKKVGFATDITPSKQIKASFDPKEFSFDKAPDWVQKQLTAMTSFKESPPVTTTAPTNIIPPTAPTTNTIPTVPPVATPADATAHADAIAKAVAEAMIKATNAEATRQTTIKALCDQAKRPEMAAKFCADTSVTVEDVRGKLFEALCKNNGPLGDEGGTSTDTTPPADENAKYRAEFKAEKAYAKEMTEAEFIAMRRIDDGLDQLPVAAPKK